MNDETTHGPIEGCIARWHQHMDRTLEGGLDSMLHPDVVFLSPIVFTPQRGIDITKAYLNAAGGTLNGDPAPGSVPGEIEGGFTYTKQILDGHHAVLEFETSIDGKYVNGIDLITCDDDGMIVEFKVMIRPLQAINLVHAQMGAMLEKMGS
jgi:hypothetical protein